jgi:hypothetical protein
VEIIVGLRLQADAVEMLLVTGTKRKKNNLKNDKEEERPADAGRRHFARGET